METEYISRDAALACFHDWMDRYGHEHTADEIAEYQRIEELPVADVVEVVRCRDCRFYEPYEVDGTDGNCRRHSRMGMLVTYEDYCSDGERRTDNC